MHYALSRLRSTKSSNHIEKMGKYCTFIRENRDADTCHKSQVCDNSATGGIERLVEQLLYDTFPRPQMTIPIYLANDRRQKRYGVIVSKTNTGHTDTETNEHIGPKSLPVTFSPTATATATNNNKKEATHHHTKRQE
jgi:hypothetical protein